VSLSSAFAILASQTTRFMVVPQILPTNLPMREPMARPERTAAILSRLSDFRTMSVPILGRKKFNSLPLPNYSFFITALIAALRTLSGPKPMENPHPLPALTASTF
jgi:hypothetical protein